MDENIFEMPYDSRNMRMHVFGQPKHVIYEDFGDFFSTHYYQVCQFLAWKTSIL